MTLLSRSCWYEAGEDAGLALLELDDLLGDVLRDDGLGDAGDGDLAALGGDLNLHLEGHFAIVVDCGGHVDGDADVDEGELGLNSERLRFRSRRRRCRSRGDGNLGTDLEGGALAVGGADARVLQDAGVGCR